MQILIADDHALLRDGLKPFVLQISNDVTVLEANDYDTARAAIAENQVDLAMLDMRMPGMQGIVGAARLRQEFPDTPMAIVSGWVCPEDALQALRIGIIGYLPKSLSGTAMLHALRLMLCGELYYPPHLLVQNLNATNMEATEPHIQAPAQATAPAETSIAMQSSLKVLTRREKEILSHLVEGASNRKIAENLGLTEITIKSHLRNVFRKIGASNRTQAVTFALNAGIQAASTQAPAAADG